MDTSIATTHQQLTLDLNADVAEWCPLAGPQSRLLAAGTYQLNEATQQREGRVYIYNLKGDIKRNSALSLDLATTFDLPGIFDFCWVPFANESVLATALADGSLRLLTVDTESENGNETIKVDDIARIESPEGGMALSVECRSRDDALGGSEETFITSYSDGFIATHQLAPSGLVTLQSWRAHNLEAWTASFHFSSLNLALSGGDDCLFKGWDLREDNGGSDGSDSLTSRAPLWVDKRSHAAGVCCIASSPFQPHSVLTGSYDEGVRLWDIRYGTRPIAVSNTKAGGGVWRLKWHPTDPELVLAACMHGGFAVLRASTAEGTIEVMERYPYQQSLGYGAGWCSEVGSDGCSVVATASFYDKLLHLWSPATVAKV